MVALIGLVVEQNEMTPKKPTEADEMSSRESLPEEEDVFFDANRFFPDELQPSEAIDAGEGDDASVRAKKREMDEVFAEAWARHEALELSRAEVPTASEDRVQDHAGATNSDRTESKPPPPNVDVYEQKRDPKFAVIVGGRIPRHNTVLTQVSIPLDLHMRLQRDSIGSLNQVLMGLVRYALQELDNKKATLHIRRTRSPR